MVWRYEKDRMVRILCMSGFACVILAVGMSRIYLGVHYASDVIAGFCVSAIWLVLYTNFAVPLLIGDEMDQPGELEDLGPLETLVSADEQEADVEEADGATANAQHAGE
jgi:hypothetical protein